MAPSVSSDHSVTNGLSVIKSISDAAGRAASAGSTESHTLKTASVDQWYCTSSLPSFTPSLSSVMRYSPTLLSLWTSAGNPLPRPPAPANIQPAAPVTVNLDIKKSSVSALDESQYTSPARPFPSQNASRLPVIGYSSSSSSSRSENGRQRSVKAGSTWFPSELRTSLDCGTPTKKRSAERAATGRPCTSSVSSGGGGSVINSPLKQFVDRHPTRNVSAAASPNVFRSSAGVGFPHQNGIAAAPIGSDQASADQPIDLSVQRRRLEPKSERLQSPPGRTHLDVTARACDEPLDLSRASSSSARSDSRHPRPRPSPSSCGRPSGDCGGGGGKMSSGMIDLQNYCSRLLSGGYSLDGPLSKPTSSSSSFSPLVSAADCYLRQRLFVK